MDQSSTPSTHPELLAPFSRYHPAFHPRRGHTSPPFPSWVRATISRCRLDFSSANLPRKICFGEAITHYFESFSKKTLVSSSDNGLISQILLGTCGIGLALRGEVLDFNKRGKR